jgi:hypothetical protein
MAWPHQPQGGSRCRIITWARETARPSRLRVTMPARRKIGRRGMSDQMAHDLRGRALTHLYHRVELPPRLFLDPEHEPPGIVRGMMRRRPHTREVLPVEKHGQRLLPQRVPPWRGARELITTASTEPALGTSDLPRLDDMPMRTFQTGDHDSSSSLCTSGNEQDVMISLGEKYSRANMFNGVQSYTPHRLTVKASDGRLQALGMLAPIAMPDHWFNALPRTVTNVCLYYSLLSPIAFLWYESCSNKHLRSFA